MANPQSSLPGLTPNFIEVAYGDSVFIPSPLIQHSVQIDRDDAENRETVRTTMTLTGDILTSGIGYHYVRAKQTELENALALDGLEFTIRATAFNPCLQAGTYIVSGIFPKVISYDIQEDIQVSRLSYTVVLESLTSPSGISGVVQNFSNSWQYSENEQECVVDIVHSISAQGINTSVSGAASNAVDNAVLRVRSLLGLDNAPSGFPGYVQPVSGSDVRFYEVTTQREETISLEDATYSVTENFRLVSGLLPFTDERTSQVQIDQDGVTTVTLQGTVRGYGRTNDGAAEGSGRSSGGTGFLNALSGFNNLVRPNWISDAAIIYDRFGGSGTLATNNPTSISISQTPCQGTIGYSITFTDDSSQNLPSGIQEMSCTVARNDPVVSYAVIAVPFSALGPVFQRMCTSNEGTYTISCNVTARNTGDEVVDTNRAIEVAEQEMIKRQPNPANFVNLILTTRNQTVDRINRSINTSWVWTFSMDIATIPSPTAPVSLGRVS